MTELTPRLPERRTALGDDKIARDWLTEVPAEKEGEFRKQLADAAPVLTVLKNILRKRYEAAIVVRQPDSDPNWGPQVAYKNGRAAELADLYRLLP